MTKEELEVNIAALELLVSEAADKSTDFKAQLEKAKQDLADINKPELTSSQMDDVYEAIERGVMAFDFSDSDNYDKEFGIDYDGRVHFENLELCNSQDLVEMIVEKVSRLFVEAECPEELDTTEADNHTVQ
tara:strand:+ start:63 stop:455 length:393 start_codon:yes stop_codon:yes gene_type:complete